MGWKKRARWGGRERERGRESESFYGLSQKLSVLNLCISGGCAGHAALMTMMKSIVLLQL